MDAKNFFDTATMILGVFASLGGAITAGFVAYRFIRKMFSTRVVEEMKHYAELHTKIAETKSEVQELRHSHHELSDRHDESMVKINDRLDEIYKILIKEKSNAKL